MWNLFAWCCEAFLRAKNPEINCTAKNASIIPWTARSIGKGFVSSFTKRNNCIGNCRSKDNIQKPASSGICKYKWILCTFRTQFYKILLKLNNHFSEIHKQLECQQYDLLIIILRAISRSKFKILLELSLWTLVPLSGADSPWNYYYFPLLTGQDSVWPRWRESCKDTYRGEVHGRLARWIK